MLKLRDGLVVKLICGDIGIVLDGKILFKDGLQFIGQYDEEFKYKDSPKSFLDIIEIRDGYNLLSLELERHFKNLDILWHRDDKFEKQLDFAESLKDGDSVIVWDDGGVEFIKVFKSFQTSGNKIRFITYELLNSSSSSWWNCRRFNTEEISNA